MDDILSSELGTPLGIVAMGMAGVGVSAAIGTVGFFLWKAYKCELNCSKIFGLAAPPSPACSREDHPYQPCTTSNFV